MAFNCIDAFNHLDAVFAELVQNSKEMAFDYNLMVMKEQLGFLRTFYLCGKKWSTVERTQSTLYNIEVFLHEKAQEIDSLLLRMRDKCRPTEADDALFLDAGVMVSEIAMKVHTFEQEIKECYLNFSKVSLQASCSPEVNELLDILDSLVKNLRDILWDDTSDENLEQLMEALEESLRFLTNLIGFARFRGLKCREMEDLLTHVEVLVVNGSRLSYKFSYVRCGDDMPGMVSELVRKIKPFESHVREIYVRVLRASMPLSQSSHIANVGNARSILGDFVDCIIGYLWELVNCSSSYMVSLKDQIQELYDGLRFLRTILRLQEDKFDELFEKMNDLVGVVVGEAGIAICSLFAKENEEGCVKEMDIMLINVLEKIKLIKAEAAEEFPTASAVSFPRTNMPGFIDFVLEKMNSVIPYDADLVTRAKDQLQLIQEDLVFLRSFLGDVMVEGYLLEELQALWSRVTKVAYEIEFILDSLVIGDALDSFVRLFDSITEEIKLIKIEALRTFQSKRHGIEVQKPAKRSDNMPSVGRLPEFNEVVVGLDDEAQKITDRLTRGTKQLDIVFIVGMPGLGKTTLARKIYNDASIFCCFHPCIWCSVSQVYNKKGLLLEILGGIVTKLDDRHFKMDENELALELYRHLKQKRYLIILDDIWDSGAWNCLANSFPNDANGSRILVTSRLHSVALQIKPASEPHSLRFLNKDESWELLQKMMSYEEGCPPALHAVGMQIAQDCKGLPLTIVIVAGILSNTGQDGWKEVSESLSKGVSHTEQCMKTIDLSYRNLPDYLKPCFLYFGAFQEDQEIPTSRLLWLWIAESFVETDETKCIEHVARDYMMDLIRRSLVTVARKGSRGGIKACIIHDVLRDFCVAKSKEEHFLQMLRGYDKLCTFNELGRIYRLSVHSKREHFAKSRLLSPLVRSLLFFADDDSVQGWWYNVLFIFRLFKLLRVLDLQAISIGSSLPVEIEFLVHLRYLAFGGRMSSLPSSIGNLSNLETLFVEAFNGGPISLPDTVWNMKKLRHLHVTGDMAGWEFPVENLQDFPNLENLETLSNLILSFGEGMEEVLRKFPNLRRLKCNLLLYEDDTGDCYILALDFMTQLESLTLSLTAQDNLRELAFSQYLMEMNAGISTSVPAEHFNSELSHDLRFHFPVNLKKLVLSNFFLPWSKISAIGKLGNLEVLKLLHQAFVGERWDMEEGEFPNLRFLKLGFLNLVKWTVFDDNFPSLQQLVLERCPLLNEVPSSLGDIPTLEMIEASGCESATSSIKQIQEKQIEFGNKDMKIRILPPKLN